MGQASVLLGLGVLLSAIGTDVRAQSRSAYEVLRAPGADQTIPYDVNNAGDTVGLAVVCEPIGAPAPGQWGFLLRDGEYSELAFPGARSTVPRSISERGEVVGYYYDDDLRAHGFRYRAGQYETLPVPGDDVFAFGVNARGQVVGNIVSRNGEEQPFVVGKQGQVSPLAAPTGVNLSRIRPVALNNAGTIVGSAEAATSGAFVYRRGTFTFVPFSTILGVNERGDVLGSPAGEPRTVYRKGRPLRLELPATFHLPLGLSNTAVVGVLESTFDGSCVRGNGFRVRY